MNASECTQTKNLHTWLDDPSIFSNLFQDILIINPSSLCMQHGACVFSHVHMIHTNWLVCMDVYNEPSLGYQLSKHYYKFKSTSTVIVDIYDKDINIWYVSFFYSLKMLLSAWSSLYVTPHIKRYQLLANLILSWGIQSPNI